MRRNSTRFLLLPFMLIALASCGRDKKPEVAAPRPVRTVIAAERPVGEAVTLTGHIAAEDEAAAAFRLSGRMLERPVNIGDRVEPGQVLAKLDPQNEESELRAARARVTSARALLNQARPAYERQRILLSQGHTPRAQYEIAQKSLANAQAQLDSAEAQLQIAEQRVAWTVLTADAPGTVTARGAEPGEVVQAGQMIVQIARKGGRDAVFDVPAQIISAASNDPRVSVQLNGDRAVVAQGRVREVAPQADPITRTFQVRVGLTDPPAAMLLGSIVTGTVRLESAAVIALPSGSLTRRDNAPAVWVVDPKEQTVALRTVEIGRFDPGTVIITQGLTTGDIVVTAGVQALHPGQKVRLIGTP